MCEYCNDIILRESFYSKNDYMNCLQYIKGLLQTNEFELIESTCDLDNVIDENGRWVNDIIIHIIECKGCGSKFKAYSDTYHGNGGFIKK